MRYLLVLIMICVSGCKIFIPTNKNISTNLENESNEALLYTIKIVKPINSNLTAVPFEINYTGRWTIASRYINPYTNKKLHIFGVDFKSLDMSMIGAVNVYVSLIDKLVHKNTGSISFGSTASPIGYNQSSAAAYKFSHIANPYETYKEIKSFIDEYKKHMKDK